MRYHKVALIPDVIAGMLKHVPPDLEDMKLSRQAKDGREER